MIKGSLAVLSNVSSSVSGDSVGTVAHKLTVAITIRKTLNAFSTMVTVMGIRTGFILVVAKDSGPSRRTGTMHAIGVRTKFEKILVCVRSFSHGTRSVDWTVQSTSLILRQGCHYQGACDQYHGKGAVQMVCGCHHCRVSKKILSLFPS